jgi:hypothetical protein
MKILENQDEIYEYDKAYCEGVCREYGFVRGLFVIYKEAARWKEAIDLVLEVDDSESFLRLMKNNPKTASVENWEYILKKKSQMGSFLKQTEGNSEIRLDMIISTMAESLGPFITVDLLIQFFKLNLDDQDFEDDSLPGVSLSNFSHLLSQGELGFQQKLIIHEILEQINSYLWTQKRIHIGPQFEMIERAELQDKEDMLSLPFVKSRSESSSQGNSSNRPELSFDNNTPTPKFFEDSSIHWGIQTNFKNYCKRVQLPLTESLISNVVVYPSGNAYHDTMLPENACVDTMLSEFSSLLINE